MTSPERLLDDLVAPYLPRLDGLTVMDLGCGRGDLLKLLGKRTSASHLIGVDEHPYSTPAEEEHPDKRIRRLTSPRES